MYTLQNAVNVLSLSENYLMISNNHFYSDFLFQNNCPFLRNAFLGHIYTKKIFKQHFIFHALEKVLIKKTPTVLVLWVQEDKLVIT